MIFGSLDRGSGTQLFLHLVMLHLLLCQSSLHTLLKCKLQLALVILCVIINSHLGLGSIVRITGLHELRIDVTRLRSDASLFERLSHFDKLFIVLH